MSSAHLEQMGIDVESVLRSIDFLEAYGDLSLSETDTVDESRWRATVDAAGAYRDGAQWALWLDPSRAQYLLDRAGDCFDAIGQPFGSYLKVVSGTWYRDPPVAAMGEQLRALETVTEEAGETRGARSERAVDTPQQQAYLFLAAAGSPPVASEYWYLLQHMATDSPHRLGVVPVGALGTPIRRLWRLASLLLRADPEAVEDIAANLGAMAGAYEENMTQAQTNEHTWRHAAAPVDVGDIDIFGVTVVASQHFGAQTMQRAVERVMPSRSDVPRAILEVAIEYANEIGGSEMVAH
jgi:hypothetical protein